MPRPFGESPFPDRKDVGRPTRRRTLAAALPARSRRRRRERQATRRRGFGQHGGGDHQMKVAARLVEPLVVSGDANGHGEMICGRVGRIKCQRQAVGRLRCSYLVRHPLVAMVYFLWSYLPSRCAFMIGGTLSPFRSSSVAAASLASHLKLNSRPTGRISFNRSFSFPSSAVILAFTTESLPAMYLHTMTMTSLSPWGKIFMTSLSTNSIFTSPPVILQTPMSAGLSSLLPSANAVRPARAKRPHANTAPNWKHFARTMFCAPF